MNMIFHILHIYTKTAKYVIYKNQAAKYHKCLHSAPLWGHASWSKIESCQHTSSLHNYLGYAGLKSVDPYPNALRKAHTDRHIDRLAGRQTGINRRTIENIV